MPKITTRSSSAMWASISSSLVQSDPCKLVGQGEEKKMLICHHQGSRVSFPFSGYSERNSLFQGWWVNRRAQRCSAALGAPGCQGRWVPRGWRVSDFTLKSFMISVQTLNFSRKWEVKKSVLISPPKSLSLLAFFLWIEELNADLYS